MTRISLLCLALSACAPEPLDGTDGFDTTSKGGTSPWAEEVCDGVDNDGDGTTDRDLEGVGLCSVEHTTNIEVELLFVVDHSPSMFEEQVAIAAVAPTLVPLLLDSALDFHLGVISMDMSDSSHQGKLRQAGGMRWIDMDSLNPEQVFASMIQMGTSGSAQDRALDALFAAFADHEIPGGYNEGFLRDESRLAVVFISDGDDDGSTVGVEDVEEYLAIRTSDVAYHAFVPLDATTCTSTPWIGATYMALADATGGVLESICAPDWTPALTSLVDRYAEIGRERYRLPVAADPASLAVVIEPGPYPPFVEYSAADLTLLEDGTVVQLPEPAPADAQITLFYAPAL